MAATRPTLIGFSKRALVEILIFELVHVSIPKVIQIVRIRFEKLRAPLALMYVELSYYGEYVFRAILRSSVVSVVE